MSPDHKHKQQAIMKKAVFRVKLRLRPSTQKVVKPPGVLLSAYPSTVRVKRGRQCEGLSIIPIHGRQNPQTAEDSNSHFPYHLLQKFTKQSSGSLSNGLSFSLYVTVF